MPSSITITSVVKEALPSRRVRIRFNDGSEREYTDPQQIIDSGAIIDSDVERLKDMYVAMWYIRNPALNPSFVVNHSLTFNLAVNPPLTFT